MQIQGTDYIPPIHCRHCGTMLLHWLQIDDTEGLFCAACGAGWIEDNWFKWHRPDKSAESLTCEYSGADLGAAMGTDIHSIIE